MQRDEALRLLGLDETYSENDLKRARRQALVSRHPDHGGSLEALDAVESAVRALSQFGLDRTRTSTESWVQRRSEKPSFVIDVLPVEAFEVLLLAAAELADVVDDDPPYRLEVRMHEPRDTWVIFEVLPEAGGSTVFLTVESPNGINLDDVRDAWIDAINMLRPN